MRSSKLFRVTAAMLLVAGLLTGLAQACPFCSAPSLTLSEQLAAAQSAVLVQWSEGKAADREAGFTGTTDYKIVQIVRDESSRLKKGELIRLDRFRPGKAGDLFLLLGTSLEDRIEWSSPLEVTEASFNYIVQAPSKESPATKRLAYFMKFLEYPDSLVATDAYAEFSNAPYEDIVPLADKMPQEKLREWLADANMTPTRVGLYGLMLGLCGRPEDATFLKSMVLEEPADFRLGIDGVMAGYLLLTGEPGLEVLNQAKLINPNAHFSETFAAMQALRFMWTYGKGHISQDDLRASMRLLLQRPNLADLVIVDLARWNDWKTMDELMALYDNENYQIPSIKRAIVRFMLIAEKDAPKNPDEKVPPHVAQARANLEILKEKDPKTVKAAQRYFFD